MDITLNQKQIFIKLFDTIVKYKTPDGRLITEELIKLQTPNSISLLDISNKIQNNLYSSLESFVEDINCFFKNTLKNYQANSQQYHDCKSLLDAFMNELQNLQTQFINIQNELKSASYTSNPLVSDLNDFDKNVELIEYLLNYQDPMTKQYIFDIFKVAPSRIQYPDYYDIIKDPIDLNTIYKRAKKHKYPNLSAICSDLLLIVKNAKTYNEPGSWIYKLATQFKKIYLAQKSHIDEEFKQVQDRNEKAKGLKRSLRSSNTASTSLNLSGDEEDNDDIDDGQEQSFALSGDSIYPQLYEEIRNLKDPNLPTGYMNIPVISGSQMKLSDPFYRLPSSYHYPDYYQEINRPIALTQIKSKIQKNMYLAIDEFLEDMFLLFNNAMTYNIPQSKIYKDAQYFKDYLRKRIAELNLQLPGDFMVKQDQFDTQLALDAKELLSKKTNSSGNNTTTTTSTNPNYLIKQEDLMDDDTLSGDTSFHTSISTVTPGKRGRGRPPRTSYNPAVSANTIYSSTPQQANKKRYNTNENYKNPETGETQFGGVGQQQQQLIQVQQLQQQASSYSTNTPATTIQEAHNDFSLINRLIEVFKEIVSLTDDKGYKIALYFIKKLNNSPNFLDLTDVERGLSEGKFQSTAKLIEETSRIIQNYKELVYGPAFSSLINANVLIVEGTSNAQLRDAYNACNLMLNYMGNNVKFKDMMMEEEQRVLDNQRIEQNRLIRIRLQNIYNELLNLQDKSTKRVLTAPFIKLPSKMEYPDYYQIILNPIDLTSINCKIIYNNMAYQTFDEFFADTDLMLSNAFIFNDPESQIYKDALLIYKFLCEKRTELSEELEGKPNVQLRVKAIFTNIYVGLNTYKDTQGIYFSDVLQDIMQTFTEKLHDLPSQYFPTHLNNNPMSLETIKRYLDSGHYTRLDVFQEHLLYCLKKALYYALMKNPDQGFDNIKQEPVTDGHKVNKTLTADDTVNASIELIQRYFVLRERHCIRTTKMENTNNYRTDTAQIQHLKYYILRSYLAFDNTSNSENDLNYLVNHFPRLLVNHIAGENRSMSLNNRQSLLLGTSNIIDNEDCGTEETNSNSNDVNSSFGDWKRGASEESVEGYEINGKTYYVGDFVYLEPSEKGVPDPHIMAVQQFTRDSDSGILYVQGCWFYRPYETYHPSTRKFFQQEVFKSDYYDKIFASKIIGKCLVLVHRDYVKYKIQEFEPKDVYVCESRYFTKLKNFKRIKHWNHISPFSEYNPNRLTFVQRENTLNLLKNMPSVFADKSYAQFIEDNSFVPTFPLLPQNEIPLKDGQDCHLQKVTWKNYSTNISSADNGFDITVGDYIEIQKNRSNLKPFVILVHGIIKTVLNLPSTVSGQSRAIYTLYGPRKFVYDLEPFIPQGSNFQKNAKDLFLLPLPSLSNPSNNIMNSSAAPSNMDTAATADLVTADNQIPLPPPPPSSHDDPNTFLVNHYPDYVTNDVDTFTVTKKLYVLGAETFSKKWPTEIREKDLFVCRYRLSIAINNSNINNNNNVPMGSNQPLFGNRFIIAPLIYENYCHEFPLPVPTDLRLFNEWYHFDNNESYQTAPSSLSTGIRNLDSADVRNLNSSHSGSTHATTAAPIFSSDNADSSLPLQNQNKESSFQHNMASGAAAPVSLNNTANSALTNLLSKKPSSTNYDGHHYQIPSAAAAPPLQTGSIPTRPSVAEVFFGSNDGGGVPTEFNCSSSGGTVGGDSTPRNKEGHAPPPYPPGGVGGDTSENNSRLTGQIQTSLPSAGETGGGGVGSTQLREIIINDYKLTLDEDDYKFIQKKAKPSGYIIYAGERRQPLMDKNPTFKFGEISKMIGLEWKQMSQEERTKYDQKAIKFGEELRSYIGDGVALPLDSSSTMPAGLEFGSTVNDKERVAKYLQKLIKKSQQMKQRNIALSGTLNSVANFRDESPTSSALPLDPASAFNFPGWSGLSGGGSTLHLQQQQPQLQQTWGQFNQPPYPDPSAMFNSGRNVVSRDTFATGGPFTLSGERLSAPSSLPYSDSKSFIVAKSIGRGPSEYRGGGIYACMWGDCDFQFEDLQDLVDHVTLQTDHVKATDGEYTCNWANCWKASKDKDPKPFLTQGRLVRHIRESHFKSAYIKNVALEHISRNYMRSSKRGADDTNNNQQQQQQPFLTQATMMNKSQIDLRDSSSTLFMTPSGGGSFNLTQQQSQALLPAGGNVQPQMGGYEGLFNAAGCNVPTTMIYNTTFGIQQSKLLGGPGPAVSAFVGAPNNFIALNGQITATGAAQRLPPPFLATKPIVSGSFPSGLISQQQILPGGSLLMQQHGVALNSSLVGPGRSDIYGGGGGGLIKILGSQYPNHQFGGQGSISFAMATAGMPATTAVAAVAAGNYYYPASILNQQQQVQMQLHLNQQQQQLALAGGNRIGGTTSTFLTAPPTIINTSGAFALPPAKTISLAALQQKSPPTLDDLRTSQEYLQSQIIRRLVPKPMFVVPPPSTSQLRHSDVFIKYIERMSKISAETAEKVNNPQQHLKDFDEPEQSLLNSCGGSKEEAPSMQDLDILDANPVLNELVKLDTIDDHSKYQSLLRPDDDPSLTLTKEDNELCIKKAKYKALNILKDKLFQEAIRMDNWMYGKA